MTLRFEAPVGSGAPLLLLHGFFSDHRAFEVITPLLVARGYAVHAVDLPGHGRNREFAGGWPELIEALEAWASKQDEAPSVLGYSMGARVLRQWLLQPGRVLDQALLAAPHPGWALREGSRRRQADEALAQRLQMRPMARNVEAWAALHVFGGQEELPKTVQCRQERLRLDQDPDGLAWSLRRFGSGTCAVGGRPARDAQITLLHGDRIVADVERAEALAKAWPEARLERIAGAGHNLVLEAPSQVADALSPRHLGDSAPSR